MSSSTRNVPLMIGTSTSGCALFHEVWDWGTRVLGLQTSGARTVAPSA